MLKKTFSMECHSSKDYFHEIRALFDEIRVLNFELQSGMSLNRPAPPRYNAGALARTLSAAPQQTRAAVLWADMLESRTDRL